MGLPLTGSVTLLGGGRTLIFNCSTCRGNTVLSCGNPADTSSLEKGQGQHSETKKWGILKLCKPQFDVKRVNAVNDPFVNSPTQSYILG